MSRKDFLVISLILLGVLSEGILLINVWAQVPTKAQIAFHSDRDGNFEIYVMDADGKNQRNLTNHPYGNFFPDWFDPAVVRPFSVSPAGKLSAILGQLKQSSK